MMLRTLFLSGCMIQLVLTASDAGDVPALRAGFPMSSFSRNSPSDARVATDVFLQRSFSDQHLAYSSTVFESDAELIAAVSAQRIDIFLVNAALHVAEFDTIGVRPILVAARSKEPLETLLLISTTDRTLSELKGGTLLIDNSGRGSTPRDWISDHLLRSGTADTTAEYFSVAETVNNASKALLPVYFGKADAAIISTADWDTMCEHNPNVRKRLHVVCRSKGLTRSLICLRQDYDDYRPSQIVDALREIQKSEDGRRFLERIGASKLVPYKDEFLLFNREMHNRLTSVKKDKGQGGSR